MSGGQKVFASVFNIYILKTPAACRCATQTQLHAWTLSPNAHPLCFPHNNEMAASKQLSGDRETSFHTSPPLCGAARTIKAIGTCSGPSKQHNCHSNGIRRASPLKAVTRAWRCRAVNLIGLHKAGSWRPTASYPLDNRAACYQSVSFSRLFCVPINPLACLGVFWHCTQEGHSTCSHILRESYLRTV